MGFNDRRSGFKLDRLPSAAKAGIMKASWTARVELVPFPVKRYKIHDSGDV